MVVVGHGRGKEIDGRAKAETNSGRGTRCGCRLTRGVCPHAAAISIHWLISKLVRAPEALYNEEETPV